MNITLENIDDLRIRANISYKEAKEALEKSEGNMIDAIILLENENKTVYDRAKKQNATATDRQNQNEKKEQYKAQADDFFLSFKKFIVSLNETRVIMYNSKRVVLDISSTITILATIFAFPIVLGIFVIGLVTGNKYKIVRKDKKADIINKVLDKAAKVTQNVADTLKEKVTSEKVEKKEVDLNK